MRPLRSAIPVLLAALVGTGGARAGEAERFRVRTAEVDGQWRCSVVADRAPLADVLGALARECGVELEGLEQASRTTLVDVDLRDRPVQQALEYVLGGVGLRVETRLGAWRVHAGVRAPASVDELRETALGAYLSALRDFPDHPAGAAALLSQARLELERGYSSAARVVLDGLVERYPASDLVPDALLLAGDVLARQGDWEQAALRYADLLRLDQPHEHEVAGRLGLARSLVWTDRCERALLLLDALDRDDPARGAADVQARWLVRARAHVECGDAQAAHAALDAAQQSPCSGAALRELLELRARSLEALGRPEEAARCWLALGRESDEGAARSLALRHAARLALELGDELSVLMIHALAEDQGVGRETARLADEARQRLTLEEPAAAADGPGRLLAEAEKLVADGRLGEAARALEALSARRDQLDPIETERYALAYGRALDAVAGVDAVLDLFREVLPSLEGEAQRRALYVFAGDLLERDGRLDDAIAAWQGSL